MLKLYEVFDIGGSSVKASVMDEEGKILNNEKIAIAQDIDGFFENLANTVNRNKKDYNVAGIAISAPGAVDSNTGIIGGASAIPYIHGPNFKEVLFEKTGLKVEIENDANCAALGECWIGAGKDANDLAFVVCGSGIGGAIVKDNRIHKGIHKHGGEFGYCIVDYDADSKDEKYLSWSKAGSTAALANNIANRKGLKEGCIDGLKAFELFNAGDKIAIEEVEKYYRYMAIGVYNIQYTYDPEVIILGGAICEIDDYIPSIEKYIDELMDNNEGKIRPVIRRCMYGNDANKIGALYHFITSNVE